MGKRSIEMVKAPPVAESDSSSSSSSESSSEDEDLLSTCGWDSLPSRGDAAGGLLSSAQLFGGVNEQEEATRREEESKKKKRSRRKKSMVLTSNMKSGFNSISEEEENRRRLLLEAGVDAEIRRGRKRTHSTRALPTEMSSKTVFSKKAQKAKPTKEVYRDPRFGGVSGEFNQAAFDSAYGFLEEKRKEEMAVLAVTARKAKSEDERFRAKDALRHLKEQQKVKDRSRLREQIKNDHMALQRRRVLQGEKAQYLTERKMKELEQVQAFEGIQKKHGSLGVEKAMTKRRQKLESKQKKYMPRERREEGLTRGFEAWKNRGDGRED